MRSDLSLIKIYKIILQYLCDSSLCRNTCFSDQIELIKTKTCRSNDQLPWRVLLLLFMQEEYTINSYSWQHSIFQCHIDWRLILSFTSYAYIVPYSMEVAPSVTD